MKKFLQRLDEVWNGKHEPPSTILPPSEKIKCKFCFAEIDPRAPVCHNCKEWQRRRPLGRLFLAYASSASAVVAVVSVTIAGWQLHEAKLKRIDAENAAAQAEEAEENTKKLAKQVDFTSLVIEAANDSRPAFDKLRCIAADKNNPFSQKANDEVDAIILYFSQLVFGDGSGKYPWPTGIDPQKITFVQAIEEYSKASKVTLPYLIQFIWENPNFSKAQKMNWLMRITREGKSLMAVVWAGYFVKEEAGLLNLPALSHVEYEAWWEKNKDKYKE